MLNRVSLALTLASVMIIIGIGIGTSYDGGAAFACAVTATFSYLSGILRE
jgi:hypothetical protein